MHPGKKMGIKPGPKPGFIFPGRSILHEAGCKAMVDGLVPLPSQLPGFSCLHDVFRM
jgi:hypothetical protein